jgi:hypothetical protein
MFENGCNASECANQLLRLLLNCDEQKLHHLQEGIIGIGEKPTPVVDANVQRGRLDSAFVSHVGRSPPMHLHRSHEYDDTYR